MTAGEQIEDPLIGSLLADRYRVTRLAGEGGMGRVYLGEHEAIGRKVAIKCLLPEMAEHPGIVERFEREARAATACGSEHIIDVFDMGRLPDGAPFMVMEFLTGEDLGDLLEREGAQPVGRVVRILRQVCDALESAHAAGIVHRDLKPENVYLVRRKKTNEFVKVLDFGISKFTEHAAGINKHLTQTGVTVGTPLYMSPEQAQGLKTTDHRTDIYALGVILFEALTGNPPFDADSFALLIVQIVTADAPDVRLQRPDVPEGLAAVIRRCLAKSPETRFENVEELNEALAPFEDIEDAPQLLEAKGRGSLFPDHATHNAGGPMTGAAVPRATEPTRIDSARGGRPTPVTAQKPAPDMEEPPPGPGWSERAPAMTGPLHEGGLDVPGAPPVPSAPSLSVPDASSATSSAPATGQSRMLAVGLVLVVLGLGATGAAYAVLSGRGEGDVTPTDNQQTQQTEQTGQTEPTGTGEDGEDIRLRVVVAPEGASIFLDDVEYPSPLDARLPRSQQPRRLRISLDGYESHEEPIMLDQDREILRVLQPAVPTPVGSSGMSRRPSMHARPGNVTATMDATGMDPGAEATAMTASPMEQSAMEATMDSTAMDPTTMTPATMDGFRDEF